MLRANLFCIAKKKVMETQYPFRYNEYILFNELDCKLHLGQKQDTKIILQSSTNR